MLNNKIKSKKANFPLLKTIFILLISTLIIITYLLALHQMKDIYIEDKKTRTQIIESKILGKCFSNEFGVIEKNQFNQKNLNQCFKEDSKVLLKITVNNEVLYLGDETEFKDKMQFCSSSNSNLLCTKLKYPIIYKESETSLKDSILTLLIIVQ